LLFRECVIGGDGNNVTKPSQEGSVYVSATPVGEDRNTGVILDPL